MKQGKEEGTELQELRVGVERSGGEETAQSHPGPLLKLVDLFSSFSDPPQLSEGCTVKIRGFHLL